MVITKVNPFIPADHTSTFVNSTDPEHMAGTEPSHQDPLFSILLLICDFNLYLQIQRWKFISETQG